MFAECCKFHYTDNSCMNCNQPFLNIIQEMTVFNISLKSEQHCPLKVFIRLSTGRWGMWVSIKCVIHMYGKSHDYS